MAIIAYTQNNPYANTPQTSQFIGRYVNRPIRPATGDRSIKLTAAHHHRPDKLSNELYGSPVFWWVFMQRNINLIRDPIFDFTVGKTIIVPTLEALGKQGVA